MTHDQIREMVRRANPVIDPGSLEHVAASDLEIDRRIEMQTEDRTAADSGRSRWRGPLVGIAAAVAILIGGGAIYLLTRDEAPPVAQPAPNATQLPVSDEFYAISQGAYFIDTDGDGPSTARATFVVDALEWTNGQGSGPVKFLASGTEEESHVSLLIGELDEVASPGCHQTEWVAAGTTAEEVAEQFATIGFVIREALTPVDAFGQKGYHMVAELPEEGFVAPEGYPGCEGDLQFDGWITANFGQRYYQAPGQLLEFWFLDVEGVPSPILVEATTFPTSSETDIAELQAVIDSLVITP